MGLILAINPGSTSTKIALYKEQNQLFVKNITHSEAFLAQFRSISEQFYFRKELILEELKKNEINISEIEVIVGRGGLLKPIDSGVYQVNDALLEDLRRGVKGQHASNLGGLIANDLAKSIPGAKAFIADPVVVDELEDIARISGHIYFERISIFHALNHKAVARIYAQKVGKRYEDLNLIIAHMGGGISVGAHQRGRVIDVNNALDGEGPFSPERSGTLPIGEVIKLCYSGDIKFEEMYKQVLGQGGLVSYLGTNSGLEIEQRIANGDEEALMIFNAMGYQIAKEIGAMSTVLKGNIDAIILTGGLAYSKRLTDFITQHIAYIAKIHIEPGEDEMTALATNGYLALTGELEVKIYK